MPESVIYVAVNPKNGNIRYWAHNAADAERLEKETGLKATRFVAEPAAVAGLRVRRMERTCFPNSPAHMALSAFCHAMHDRNIDGADMRAAMLWFLGLEECEEQAAAGPITQPVPQQEAQEPVAWYFKSPARPGEQPLIKKLDWRPHNRNWRPLVELAAVERATAPQPSPASQGDALPREELAWMVVQEACETEPADSDDPECIRILRRDLKSSVLAAFLRHDAARAAQEGKNHG